MILNNYKVTINLGSGELSMDVAAPGEAEARATVVKLTESMELEYDSITIRLADERPAPWE